LGVYTKATNLSLGVGQLFLWSCNSFLSPLPLGATDVLQTVQTQWGVVWGGITIHTPE